MIFRITRMSEISPVENRKKGRRLSTREYFVLSEVGTAEMGGPAAADRELGASSEEGMSWKPR